MLLGLYKYEYNGLLVAAWQAVNAQYFLGRALVEILSGVSRPLTFVE